MPKITCIVQSIACVQYGYGRGLVGEIETSIYRACNRLHLHLPLSSHDKNSPAQRTHFGVDPTLLGPMSACVGECVECSSPRCDNCEAFLPCLLQTCMTCPWDICSKILCHECYKNHRHSVLVAQPHFDRWVNELMGSWVVLRGLRFTGEVNGDHAYCCLEVRACVI